VQNSLLDFFLIVKSKLICTPLDGHELSVFCPCVAVCMRSI
jgi:hypothetical protein